MKRLNKDITTFQCCEFICTYEQIKNDRNGNGCYEVRITYTFTDGEKPNTTVFTSEVSGDVKEHIKNYIYNNLEVLK